MSDIGILWQNRERPSLFGLRWLKLWARRALATPGLLGMLLRKQRLRLRGAKIGRYSVVAPIQLDGNLELLDIGDCTFVGRAHIALHASIKIGDCAVISDFATLLTGTHSVTAADWPLIALPIEVGDYAWIGQGAMVLPGVVIGEGAVIGAGAVVSQSVDPFNVVVGNPARPLDIRRPTNLCYVPVSRVAGFAAWLGTNPIAPPTRLKSPAGTTKTHGYTDASNT